MTFKGDIDIDIFHPKCDLATWFRALHSAGKAVSSFKNAETCTRIDE